MTEDSQADYIFVECDADHAFEISSNNNRWINRIDGGVTIPENSKLSVQYAGINIIGSGTDVIEFKGTKIGKSTVYEYSDVNEEYVKKEYDVFDNEITLFLEFYKTTDGLYSFPIPFPYYNYSADHYNTYYSSLDNTQDLTTDEIQKGIDSSTYKSGYNFAFPTDNKRYTIMRRNPFTIYESNTDNGRLYGGVDFAPRFIGNYEYSVYNNKVEIKLNKGFITPSSISEQISQQMEKHSEPVIKNYECWEAPPSPPTTPWTGSVNVEGGLTCETETFKLFKCATRRTFWELAYNNYNNVEAPAIKNNDVEVQKYQEPYEYIGVYNPDIFTSGRLIEKTLDYYNKQKINVFLEQVDCSDITSNQQKEFTMYTNIPWDPDILIQYKYLFDYIEADNEMYQNRVAKETGSTPTNSVFLHTEPLRAKYASLAEFKKSPFGTEYSVNEKNVNITNPLYITRNQTYKNEFMETLAYGVFKPWRTNDGNFYCSVQGRFYIEMITQPITVPPTPDMPVFKFYSANSGFGGDGNIFLVKEEYTVASFPKSAIDYTRFSWDRHMNAHGNQSISLWNGLSDQSELVVDLMTNKDEHTFSNSFLTRDGGKEYFYDTGNDQIYLGCDNFLFNFDLNESRFNISQLHTARKQFNNALSGYDGAVLRGVGDVGGTGTPDISYTDAILQSNPKKVLFPLEINGNGNTSIYEISPSLVSIVTQEIADQFKILKANTIFDANCGVFISNFGVDNITYDGSLWDILGFSQEQTKTYMTDGVNDHIILYRNHRFLTSGVNIIDVTKYPFTSNAQINSNEIISWRTNPFSVSYFNTLNIPNNIRNIEGDVHNKFAYETNTQPYRVSQNQISTEMFSDRLARKTDIPFYQIRSDILPLVKYYGGDNQSNGKLPVLAIVNKSFSGTDFFVNQGDNSMEYIIKKQITINTVVTDIFDNFGRPALLDKHSSIIYRFELPYIAPEISPFTNLNEAEVAESQKQPIKKK